MHISSFIFVTNYHHQILKILNTRKRQFFPKKFFVLKFNVVKFEASAYKILIATMSTF